MAEKIINKRFTIYLSFKNKSTAEKWLAAHGLKTKFTDSQIISVKVTNEAVDKNARTQD